MDWQQELPGSFGHVDGIFAMHPLDEERAKGAIKTAKAAGAAFEDFEKEMVWHLYKRLAAFDMKDVRIQVAKAKKMWGFV